MKISSDNKKLKANFRKTLVFFWKNLFLVLIFIFILDLLAAGIFLWVYYVNRGGDDIEAPRPVKVNQTLINQFGTELNEREIQFNEALFREHFNPFDEI